MAIIYQLTNANMCFHIAEDKVEKFIPINFFHVVLIFYESGNSITNLEAAKDLTSIEALKMIDCKKELMSCIQKVNQILKKSNIDLSFEVHDLFKNGSHQTIDSFSNEKQNKKQFLRKLNNYIKPQKTNKSKSLVEKILYSTGLFKKTELIELEIISNPEFLNQPLNSKLIQNIIILTNNELKEKKFSIVAELEKLLLTHRAETLKKSLNQTNNSLKKITKI